MSSKTLLGIQPWRKELKSGLTPRVLGTVFYTALVFQPAFIWLSLVTGSAALGGSISYAILLLFAVIARYIGKPLSRQEGAVLVFMSSWMSASTLGTSLIYGSWLRRSAPAIELGLAELIPKWSAVPIESKIWELRTFLHPDWWPIFIVLIINQVCNILAMISLALLFFRTYVVEEKLSWPIQEVASTTCITITEGRGRELEMFGFFSIIGGAYAAYAYVIPFVFQSIGVYITTVPIPWVDLTSYIERAFPGACLGIATDIALVAVGMIVPFNVVISMFIGSIATYFIGNYFIVSVFKTTKYFELWVYGNDIQTIWQQSLLYVWVAPIIGAAITAGILPALRRPRILINSLKALSRRGKGGRRGLWLVLAGWLAGSIGQAILVDYLAPDFPFWIFPVLIPLFTFIFSMISAYSYGETGAPIEVPHIDSLVKIGSGYAGADIWFAPTGISGAGGWVGTLKYMDLVDCDIGSLIKAYLLTLPLAMFFSILFTQLLWNAAPIPSARYPATQVFWPINASVQLAWVTRPTYVFSPVWILGGGLLALTSQLSSWFLHVPISTIGIVAGFSAPPPIYITQLLGGFIGLIIRRKSGEDWWKRNRALIAGGIISGEGVMVIIGVAINMINRSLWTLPY